ncbi:MAG TPA: hypothetical protein PLB52_04490 [Candidatus Moranbacteria bacterium]|nr:hypothetical protein [Candidatus Moranbacteria bacterium]
MSFDLKTKPKKKPVESYIKDDFRFAEETEKELADFSENTGKILYSWRAPQFEVYEKSGRWYIIAALFILVMIVYALYTNGPIMAVTFILIGIVGYIYSQKDPLVVTFAITDKGVIADKEIYLYENIKSFWIFYDPHHTKTISLHTKASFMPFIHIPFGDENPAELHKIMTRYIPEIKQDPSLIDAIERVLHI